MRWFQRAQTPVSDTASSPPVPAPEDSDDLVLRQGLTVVLGGPGVGKTTLLRRSLQMAHAAGRPVLAIDPLGDLQPWFQEIGGQILTIEPAASRINPFDAEDRPLDEQMESVLPLFSILLDTEIEEVGEDLLRSAMLGAYSISHAPLLRTVIEQLAIIEPPAPSAERRRDQLVEQLGQAGLTGAAAPYFAGPTNLLISGEPLLIRFDPRSTRSLPALSAYLALRIASYTIRPDDGTLLVIDDLDRLLYGAPHALDEMLVDLVRPRAGHWPQLLTAGYQVEPRLRQNVAYAPRLYSLAGRWLILPDEADRLRGNLAAIGGLDPEPELERLRLDDSQAGRALLCVNASGQPRLQRLRLEPESD